MDVALRAIAEPHRRRILSLVRDGELSAGEIAAHFDVTRPAISQHLNVLKEAGLVSERRSGTRRLYLARPEGLTELKAFIEEFWDERLQALKREAERKELSTMKATAERIAVEREVTIAASPQTVWDFLVDPEKATRWMGQAATFDLRPGGLYQVDLIPGSTVRGEFVEIDPPRLLAFTWGWEPDGASSVHPGSTTVEFELVPAGDGTTLRLTHHELPSDEAAASHSRGWDHYLERLAAVAAGDDPGTDPWIATGMPLVRSSHPRHRGR